MSTARASKIRPRQPEVPRSKGRQRMSSARIDEVLADATVVIAFNENEDDTFVIADSSGFGVGRFSFEHAMARLKLAKQRATLGYEAEVAVVEEGAGDDDEDDESDGEWR